jgi:hypothetical protein
MGTLGMRCNLVKTLLVVLIVGLSGCVLYPTQRTYFAPDERDGTPGPSSSCGYNAARNDSVSRDFNGLYLKVSPTLEEGKRVSASMLFRGAPFTIIDPTKYELHSLPTGAVFKVVDYKVTKQAPDISHRYYSTWLHITYGVEPAGLTEIAIVFPANSVIVQGEPLAPTQFRFRKITKNDIYYSSINC